MRESSEPAAAAGDLLGLRAELDRFDDAIHDLLMRRAGVVEQVAAAKAGVALRPGREAAMIRRLLARHHGRLPRQAVVRIWREMLAGTTAMQRPFVIAVCDRDPGQPYAQAAREQYGALTPIRVHPDVEQALAEVSAGRASAAVLPAPVEGEPAWWAALMRRDQPRLRVVARLPFWSARPEGTPTVQALVVGAIEPDESGDDRSLIGLELDEATGREALTAGLAAADLAADTLILHGGAAATQALADVRGFVTDDDPRLSRLGRPVERAIALGAYAVPIASEEASP